VIQPTPLDDEERLKDFFYNAPIGIFRTTLDGHLIEANNKLANYFGYSTPDELLASIRDIAIDAYFDPEKRVQILKRLTNESGWIREEVQLKRKDGSLAIGVMTARKAIYEVRKQPCFEGFIEDITERKRSEETLRMNENQFRAFFEQGSDGVVILDPQTGRILKFNDQACRQLGYNRDEFAKLMVADFEFTESTEEILSHIQKVMKEGIDTFETKHRTKQGQIINVKVTAQIIKTGTEPIYYCLYRDITEYKQTETTLALSQARLLEAQSVSNTGSWDLDLITKEMWGSEEAHNIYGLELSPGLRLPLPIVQSLVESEYRPMMDKALTDLIASRGEIPYDVEFYIHRKNDNSRRAIHSRARLVCDTSGRPLRVAGTIQDITSRKQIEVDIRRLNNELEERVRERTYKLEAAIKELEAFSYSVSHDLRAPLRSINGYCTILLAEFEGKLDDEAIKYLHVIQQSAIRMDQLINDLHKLSRISRAEIKNNSIDLSELAKELLEEVLAQTPNQNIEIQIQEGMLINGDRNLLRIVLENLVSNSVKFTSKNAGQAKIQIGMQNENENPVYFVRDNGSGFDMAYADKLFKPFQRIHDDKDFSGTGIGLSIVDRIIHRHNGRIWAESKPGQGATFYFTIGS